jgi:hypothetical protein
MRALTFKDDHGPDDAVVTLGGLDPQLVLDHETSGGDRLREAEADLHAEAALGALLFATSTRAGAHAIATDVPGLQRRHTGVLVPVSDTRTFQVFQAWNNDEGRQYFDLLR